MDLSIITVPWNVKDKLRENFKALFASEGEFSFEIIAVDNNSHDGSADMIAGEFPQVKLIRNKENAGFARACNQGVKIATGDYILLLNPDMRVLPDTLLNMLEWMRDHEQASVAGCCLVDERGNTINHVRRFPGVWDQLAIILKLPHLFPGVLNKYLLPDFDYTKPGRVDSVRGAFFMVYAGDDAKLPFWLDERYFLWFEEVDFCRRIKEAGGEVWYTPAAKCVDYIGQSFGQVNSLKKQHYLRASMLKYFKKWHPGWRYWLLRLAWPIGLAMTWAGEKLNFKSRAKT
ncbi:MAG: glycosyltransferase family 2 protein [Planctomycetes bacterium]|jgi:hypothetical protein|nr:glycosyltransferase family 2 protein [Planctomycetota bacterium]